MNKTLRSGMNKRRQSGATMTEFIIAMPVFILLIFVIAELALMYQAKSVVDMAALAAARAGAINGASPSSMQNAAVVALTPLHTHGTNTADLIKGGVASKADTVFPAIYGSNWSNWGGYTLSAQRVVRIDILNPTPEAATAFAVTRAGNRIIPNDNLMYRQTSESSDVNIQDANLLKIKLTYLYKTKMPLTQYFFAPFVDANLTRTLFTSDLRHAPLTAPEAEGRVPLVAYATVRMQSDFKLASLEGGGTGSGSTSASSGSGSGSGSGSSGSAGLPGTGSTGLNFSGSSGSSDSGNAGAGEEGCE